MSNDKGKKIRLKLPRIKLKDPPIRMLPIIKLDSWRDRLQLPKSAGN